ncbi:MauE/DoxX family redox-associated membrane protein [Agriterribacter humi]|uniref:MauE/DoxX family redox-associated membrane protein n=1 Tax=Agriterribacter humi TaxID=1104781 RepID=UPI0012641A9B|nr:MauE/DoxX family redox-associated membrane protein [Agriterribacter humi]
MRITKWLYEFVCLVLILNFFYEGIQKLAYSDAYGFWITHAPVIKKFGAVLQYAVPLIEIAIAILLIIARYRSIAFIAIIVAEIVFILWVMSVYLFTGYLFWPYDTLWDDATWMQKMIYSLILAWLAFAAISYNGKKEIEHKKNLLRNTSANVN